MPDSAAGFTDGTPQLYRESHDSYRTPRAQHPNSPNRHVFSSLPQQMAFFPFEQLDTISPRPLLLIAGSRPDALFWSRQVCEKAREPKELHVVEGATHIDMYDRSGRREVGRVLRPTPWRKWPLSEQTSKEKPA